MTAPTIHVACLCAAWCQLCEDYELVFRRVANEFSSHGSTLQWHWIDIEEEADFIGDVDVETFPMLIIVDSVQVRFAGPLMPQPETLRHLLRATVIDAPVESRWPEVSDEIDAFALRLRHRSVPSSTPH